MSLPGVAWHIIQRGNNRSACFFHDQDRRLYLQFLRELAPRFECAVHAYVLMTNHVHLLLTPACKGGPARLMKHLGQRYVQYVNRTYGRSGTLWEGRFRSCLAQSEEYVLACYRYIEFNPVRAGMVDRPEAYRWTSYPTNALGRPDELITPHDEYLRLGRDEKARREAYRGLFSGHLNVELVDSIRQATNGNVALGGARFQREVEIALQRRARRGRGGRPKVLHRNSNVPPDIS